MSIRHLWSCISDLSGKVIVWIGHSVCEGQPSLLLKIACVALDVSGMLSVPVAAGSQTVTVRDRRMNSQLSHLHLICPDYMTRSWQSQKCGVCWAMFATRELLVGKFHSMALMLTKGLI